MQYYLATVHVSQSHYFVYFYYCSYCYYYNYNYAYGT